MKGKVNCTCGWSWNKSDSSAKDMYICHECGRDNSNNMKNGGWLDSYDKAQDGSTIKDKPKLGAGKYYTTTGDIVDWGTPEYEEAYNRGEVVTDEGGRSPIALKEVVVKGKKKKKWWEYDGGEEENPNDKRRRREDEWRKLTGTKEYKEEDKKQKIAYDKSIIADRKTRMVDAMKAQDVDIIGNPNWREVLATETQSTGDKFRLFPNDPHSFIDDWLNPGVMIGNMASSLGSAPLRAREEDSFMPYISSIGAPLLMGRVMGSGSINPFGKKLWTNQVSNRAFLNNMALGIPGMVKASPKILSSAASAARAIGSGFKNAEIPSELHLDVNQPRFNQVRSTPKVKKKLLNQWEDKQLDNGLIEQTPLRKGSNQEVVKKIVVPDKGEIALKTSVDASGNPVYYFSANVAEGGLWAGKAFKHLEQFIPKGSKILEQKSLSTDSFYNVMQRVKNPKKFTWIDEGQFLPLNNAGKNKIFSNSDKIVPGSTNVKFEDYNEAMKALAEFNSRITIKGMPKAKLSKIVDDFRLVKDGPLIKKTTFGIDVPNVALIKQYKQGGILKNGGWLDNYNDSQASAPEGMIGDGYSNVGRNYSPAWGGQFAEGGNISTTQEGTTKKPLNIKPNGKTIYVESYNDPRYKAYQDSLSLYKGSKSVNDFIKKNNIGTFKKDNDKPLSKDEKKYVKIKKTTYDKNNVPLDILKKRGNNSINPNIKPISYDKYVATVPKEFGFFGAPSDELIYENTVLANYKNPQQEVKVKPTTTKQTTKPTTTKQTTKPTKQNVLQKREPVQSLTPLQPIGIQNDFNIEATPLPVLIPEAQIPKSYKLRTQLYTMNGPVEMDHLGYYNNQEASLEQLMKIQAEADAYNANIQKKYVDDLSDYNQIIQDRGKDRAGKIKMEVVATPNYQMGGFIQKAQNGVDMYDNPMLARRVDNTNIDRSYYDPRLNTMNIGSDYNMWHDEETGELLTGDDLKYHQDKLLAHENYHAMQHKEGRDNYDIAHSTDNEQWARMQKRPELMSTNAVWNNFYNRSDIENQQDYQDMINYFPESRILNEDLLFDKVLDGARYNNPSNAEGEAKFYEDTGVKFQNGGEMRYYQNGLDWKPKGMKNGGWLDGYEKAQGGLTMGTTSIENDVRESSAQAAKANTEAKKQAKLNEAKLLAEQKENKRNLFPRDIKVKQPDGTIKIVNTGSPEYEEMYKAGNIQSPGAGEGDTPFYGGQLDDLVVQQKMTPLLKGKKDYGYLSNKEAFVNRKKDEYIKSLGSRGNWFGATRSNFPETVLSRINREYDYNQNTRAIEDVAKAKGFDLNTRGEWIYNLTPGEKEALINSKYSAQLNPNEFSEMGSGIQQLANTAFPGQPFNFKIPGLTERELEEDRESWMSPLKVAAPFNLLGNAAANFLKNGSDYVDRPFLGAQRMGNVDVWDSMMLNPLNLTMVEGAANLLTRGLPALAKGVPAAGRAIGEGFNSLRKMPTSIAPELRQGLRTAGPSLESSVDNITPTFKSEIDWSKWNKEIPENTQLMDEYKAIEQQAKADGTWMKYEKKVLDEEKTLNNKKLFDEQEKEFNLKNAQEEEVRKSLYEADKAKIEIEETNKLLDSKFQDYFDNASAQWKRNFENDPESKLEFLDIKGVNSKEIDNALESLSSNVKSRETDLLTKYESAPINKFDIPNESVYNTSIEDFSGTPEQFIQSNSENFKKAYPEGWETVWRGGDRNPELNTKYIKNGEVIFTSKDEYGANVYNRSNNPEVKLSNTETPPEGLTKLYAPKTENKIVIDGDDSYMYDGRRISGDRYRTNYARLDAINQTPSTLLQQENLNTFQKWMRNKYPEVDLTDRTMTDHFASFLNSPEGRNINRVEFKKIFDGTIDPIDVEVHNLNNQKQLKSMFGNNGMFDMTNPNIYKSVLPIGLGLGLGAASQLEQKREGGIIKDDRGQWDHPGEITRISGGNITMKRDPKTGKALTEPILGIADTGEEQWMYPGEDYNFEGANYVTEYPKGKKPRMAKNGLRQEQKGLQNLDNLLNFTNYNKPQPGGWLSKYE